MLEIVINFSRKVSYNWIRRAFEMVLERFCADRKRRGGPTTPQQLLILRFLLIFLDGVGKVLLLEKEPKKAAGGQSIAVTLNELVFIKNYFVGFSLLRCEWSIDELITLLIRM